MRSIYLCLPPLLSTTITSVVFIRFRCPRNVHSIVPRFDLFQCGTTG
jgi:hypothetical protein